MRVLICTLILISLSACAAPTARLNTNSAVVNTKPSPELTLSEKERRDRDEKLVAERDRAIADFLAKTFPGWSLKGISEDELDCDELSDDPCDLLLTNGKKDKVIAVLFRRFILPGGQKVLVAFEARVTDLSLVEINKLKSNEKSRVLENLSDLDSGDRDLVVRFCRDNVSALLPDPSYDDSDHDNPRQ